jgi:beta-lactamase class A
MAAIYSKIEKEELSLNTKLSQDVTILNEKFNIDKDLAEKKEGVITETVNEALIQMITVSDNYSALLLTENIGVDNLQKFLITNGLINSKVGTNDSPPTTTAYDIALYFYKLYNGEFASAPKTTEMISLLKRQALNEKIPKYLPKSVQIAHKTGELDDYSHDAGIIYTLNNRYIISILAKNTDREKANEDIAKLSKAIYEYFEK